MYSRESEQAIQSVWWRRPLEALFPDKTFDGQFQNPKTQQVFDFDDRVMVNPNPLGFIESHITYYPPSDNRNLFTIFIPGLGQTEATSSKRSRRYAERLLTGIANLNNGSYIKRNPILTKVNPLMDWIEATVHRLDLSGSPVIGNCARLILYGINHRQVINFATDSHGTILLGRGLQAARRRFILGHASRWNAKEYQYWEQRWEELSNQFINVVTFGNGYRIWVKGPKYIMIFIDGDPLACTVGINPDNVQPRQVDDSRVVVCSGDPLTTTKGMGPDLISRAKRNDIQFLVFESIFEPGNFEAHNMMYTIELLRQSFVKNNLPIGDFVGLYHALRQGSFEAVTAAEAMAENFPWPDDMADYTWNATGAFSKILGRISA
ncbi:MAG: hypothetical protein AAGD25_11370 [Cyanobacteria bacterium P01_F01_bin.150]